jgi:urease accessory protein
MYVQPNFPKRGAAMKPIRHLSVLVLLWLTPPALAHHPMGGTTPRTWTEGLLSGFGHPVIGVDHLLFIIAAGMACFYFGQRAWVIVALLAGALVGTLLHVQAPGLPYHDVFVAASLIALGVLMCRRSAFLRDKTVALLFAASGMAHGYAYGEAIVGAEVTPLIAYMAGFTLIQFAIALGGYYAARFVASKKPALALAGAAGGVLAVAGAGFLAIAVTA